MQNIYVSLDQAGDLCRNRKATGRWFGATTTKRTNGKPRRFIARGGVKQGVTGQGLSFDPAKKDLLGIWDAVAKGFRFLDLRTLSEVRIKGIRYIVE